MPDVEKVDFHLLVLSWNVFVTAGDAQNSFKVLTVELLLGMNFDPGCGCGHTLRRNTGGKP